MRRIPKELLLVWLLATVPATLFQFLLFKERTIPTLVESGFYLAWLAFLGPVIASLFGPLGRWTKRALLGALGIALFGQLAEQSRFTYPAVQWGMYSELPATEIEVLEYQVRTRSGATRSVDPLRAFPSLSSFRLSYLLQDLASASTKPDAPAEVQALWRDTLVSVGEQLNRLDGADPIISVEVSRSRFAPDAWRPGAAVERPPIGRESILTVAIP